MNIHAAISNTDTYRITRDESDDQQKIMKMSVLSFSKLYLDRKFILKGRLKS